MTQDEHNPEGTDYAAQGHYLAASKATPPAPALPQEVEEAVARFMGYISLGELHRQPEMHIDRRVHQRLCAALAPHWPRPAPVTADARALAEAFHDAYERLAPSFGYTTRTDTRKFDPDSPNGKLMQAVVAAVVGPVVARMNEAEAELRESPGHLLRRARNAEARAEATEEELERTKFALDDTERASQKALRDLTDYAKGVETERDQLRAELERLKTCATCQSTGDGMPCAYPTETAKALRAQLADEADEVQKLTEMLNVERAQVAGLEAQLAAAQEDTADMDFLSLHSVAVREPLRFGSKELFTVTVFQGDGEERPSRLREAVRAARREGGAR